MPFGKQAGVPLVLNTWFNENEPVVCTLEEALDCLLRISMDLRVVGDMMVSRQHDAAK